jgi:succinate-semialdehyde dehydrogenase/glutarate-semialdehyde dehydrogenase
MHAMLKSFHPATGDLIATYPLDSQAQIERKLQQAHACFKQGRWGALHKRRSIVCALAAKVESQRHQLALLMANEMGKPITQGLAEIDKCALLCRYMAEHAECWLAEEPVAVDGLTCLVRHDPLGTVLGIMPWNYPFWQVFRFVVPAVLAGNTVLLKHASNVSGCAQAMEKLMRESGAPEGGFEVLYISANQVGTLIADDRIAAVTLTGSEQAGASVAAAAGRFIKPVVLELGGNNSFIVCHDAQIERAVDKFITGRFQNTGQSCIAAKRLLLHRSIHDDFIHALTGRMANMTMGMPENETVFIGPMARADLAKELENQMNQSLAEGANLVQGGQRDAAWFTPALLLGVKPGMTCFDEETFGPLAAVCAFDTFDQAVDLSNRSRFGLGVSVFSADAQMVLNSAARFNEGAVFINDIVQSHPALPFGGVKRSGVGRELGKDGMRSFVNRKTVVVNNG